MIEVLNRINRRDLLFNHKTDHQAASHFAWCDFDFLFAIDNRRENYVDQLITVFEVRCDGFGIFLGSKVNDGISLKWQSVIEFLTSKLIHMLAITNT